MLQEYPSRQPPSPCRSLPCGHESTLTCVQTWQAKFSLNILFNFQREGSFIFAVSCILYLPHTKNNSQYLVYAIFGVKCIFPYRGVKLEVVQHFRQTGMTECAFSLNFNQSLPATESVSEKYSSVLDWRLKVGRKSWNPLCPVSDQVCLWILRLPKEPPTLVCSWCAKGS